MSARLVGIRLSKLNVPVNFPRQRRTQGALAMIICLQYDLPDLLAEHALAWVPRSAPGSPSSILFHSEGGEPWMASMSEYILAECIPQTTGQRCADLFILRWLSVMDTTGARQLKKDAVVRSLLGVDPS